MASLDNIRPYLEEYAELKRASKNLADRMKELDPLIRPVLVDRGEQYIDGWSFECVTMPGRKTFDKKRFVAENPGVDLSAYDKVGAPFTKLNVKESEGNG